MCRKPGDARKARLQIARARHMFSPRRVSDQHRKTKMAKDDEKSKEEKSAAVDQLFFKSRNVIITGEINDKLAQKTVTHLLALAEDGDDPINLFISSPGGHVESGDMVHDMIKFIKPRVRTIGSGWVASAGALIFVGADKEDRYCLPNTRFL